MIMKSSLFSTIIVSVAGIAFAAAASVLAAGAWQVLSIRAEADAARGEALQNEVKALELQAGAVLAARTKAARSALSERSIPAGGAAGFLSAIEDLAAAAQVTISVSSLTATPPTDSAPGALMMAVQMSGSFPACMRFLQLLESQGVALSIPTVVLSHDASGGRWRGNLTLSALSFDKP
jgi:hypothetical protein